MTITIHVVPHPLGWAVKFAGDPTSVGVFDTQKPAIACGRGCAKPLQGELIIHAKNGQFRDSESYGRDPCPTKDTK